MINDLIIGKAIKLGTVIILIVVLTGVDGCGKTVVSRYLILSLMKKSCNVRVVWVKSLHTLAYLVYMFFRRVWGVEYVINPRKIIIEHYVTSWIRKLRGLWGFIEFVSVLPWIFIVYMYRFLGYVVVCDRFIVDFLATVSIRVGELLWWRRSLWGKFLLALQKRFKTVHLMISLETALERRPNVEYSLEELVRLMDLYRVIGREVGAFEIVNEDVEFGEVIKKIIDYI